MERDAPAEDELGFSEEGNILQTIKKSSERRNLEGKDAGKKLKGCYCGIF